MRKPSFTRYSSLVTHHSLLITHYSSLVTHHSLLITRYSSLVTHYSLLITFMNLECSSCSTEYPADQLINLCRACGAPLLVRYELAENRVLRDEVRTRRCDMWRYREVLPPVADDEIVTLGE